MLCSDLHVTCQSGLLFADKQSWPWLCGELQCDTSKNTYVDIDSCIFIYAVGLVLQFAGGKRCSLIVNIFNIANAIERFHHTPNGTQHTQYCDTMSSSC